MYTGPTVSHSLSCYPSHRLLLPPFLPVPAYLRSSHILTMALISYLFRHLFAAAVIQTALSQTTVHFDLLASLKTIAEYSAAAYCPGNYDQSTQNSSFCPEDVCPDLQKPNIGLEYAFNGTSRSDARAILAIDHDEQQITISFRGTVSDNDWQTNGSSGSALFARSLLTLCTLI